jgi:hypothetical protein
MKPNLIYLIAFLISGISFVTNINAQVRTTLVSPTYKFEYGKTAKGDTANTLYCVMKVTDLRNFEKIFVSYNNKTKQFITQNILKVKSADYSVEGSLVYFKIEEQLDEPFVIIEGIDKTGKKHIINNLHGKGQVVNSRREKENWQKSTARIDSMDYIRQYEGVYKGKDGKPRFKDKQGKVYLIEKDHIRPE